MEERRTAAVVLSILALIVVFFTIVVPYFKLKRTYTLSFKTCHVNFKYENEVDTTDDGYRSAQNKLALCLCNAYDKTHDTTTSKHIMNMYQEYGNSVCPDTIHYNNYKNLDSILKYRTKAFDPHIIWD